MKKRLVSGVLGLGLALGVALVPTGAANAYGNVVCPSGRTVAYTSAKPFSVRVYVTNPGKVYSSVKVGSQYKVYTGRQTVLEWYVVSSSATVTADCAA